jgi:hypothetical protein
MIDANDLDQARVTASVSCFFDENSSIGQVLKPKDVDRLCKAEGIIDTERINIAVSELIRRGKIQEYEGGFIRPRDIYIAKARAADKVMKRSDFDRLTLQKKSDFCTNGGVLV